MSLLVTVLVVLAASATVLAGALFFGFLTVPGTGTAQSSTRPPSSLSTPSPTASGLPTAAPSSVASASPTPGPTAGGTHVVQTGESLSTIGELYGVPWLQIAEANGIPEPYVIQVGQELVIPIPAAPTSEAGIHIVQSGESIISIAELYGIDPTTLADANDIADWNLIFVGQRLVIPDGSATPVTSPTP
jgi:LysM repeat protein